MVVTALWCVRALALFRLLRPVCADDLPDDEEFPWLTSSEFIGRHALFALSYKNKTLMSYDNLLADFITECVRSYPKYRIRAKEYSNIFTCQNYSTCELVTYDSTVDGLMNISQVRPVMLRYVTNECFQMRAALTVQTLTIKHNYFLYVYTTDETSRKYGGTVDYRVYENVLNVNFQMTIKKGCTVAMGPPYFTLIEADVHEVTGLDGSVYRGDVVGQIDERFLDQIKKQVETFYRLMFTKMEEKGHMSSAIYGAFVYSCRQAAVNRERKLFHPKSNFRQIYLNRKKGYNMDKYGINVGAGGPLPTRWRRVRKEVNKTRQSNSSEIVL